MNQYKSDYLKRPDKTQCYEETKQEMERLDELIQDSKKKYSLLLEVIEIHELEYLEELD